MRGIVDFLSFEIASKIARCYTPTLVHGKPGILHADHLRGAAVELFRVCCAQDLEGIVIKAARGPYGEAPRSWLKVINPDYSQHVGRREMFERFNERQASRREPVTSA
jgi:hypothetical protein